MNKTNIKGKLEVKEEYGLLNRLQEIRILLVMAIWITSLTSYGTEEQIIIREATLQDEAFLKKGWRIYQPFHSRHISEQKFMDNARQALSSKNYHIIYAATNEQVIGIITYNKLSELYWGTYYHIDSFVVDKGYRSQGVGKQLMGYVKEQAKKEGILEKLCLETASDNTGGIRFYEREGFTRRAIEYGINPQDFVIFSELEKR
ncbi:MAG: GNAT family N-acetyltransferase [Candidatus Paracaedibacter sp.]